MRIAERLVCYNLDYDIIALIYECSHEVTSMVMTLSINWLKPWSLYCGTNPEVIYECDGLEYLPNKPGVYIFARRYGKDIIPLYVGRAQNLYARIKQQLNTVKLMKGIENAPQGQRILLVGELATKGGQNLLSALKIAEDSLIEYCMVNGYDILNKQGKHRATHEIDFSGNLESRAFSGKHMKSRAAS